MSGDAIAGCVIIACSLLLLTFLVFWSRATINRISRQKLKSAREIQKALLDDE